jgi:Asp-tRNA(Asn)/Glu-tRNA(Gln) amidotransferase A subunit family amidase
MHKRQQILEEISSQWHKLNLDLVLCPTLPFPALPIKAAGKLKRNKIQKKVKKIYFLKNTSYIAAFIYTALWNLCDFPAGVVKFGTESGTNLETYAHEEDFFLQIAQKAAKKSIGMPISVQLVGLPFQEELVLRAMMELEQLRS